MRVRGRLRRSAARRFLVLSPPRERHRRSHDVGKPRDQLPVPHVQGRSELRRELTLCLGTGWAKLRPAASAVTPATLRAW